MRGAGEQKGHEVAALRYLSGRIALCSPHKHVHSLMGIDLLKQGHSAFVGRR